MASKIKFTKVIHSTMIRAIETADIIRGQLPSDIPVSVDPLLCEGAPIPPEPPIGHWKPQVYVTLNYH
jgi:serine/threonine-protein phosphatase PGAM5